MSPTLTVPLSTSISTRIASPSIQRPSFSPSFGSWRCLKRTGVPVAVVDVVDVVPVQHGLVSAALAVLVVVALVGDVRARLALVVVAVVRGVQMAVVCVVDVVAVRYRLVSAVRAVGVVVGRVFLVERGHDVRLPCGRCPCRRCRVTLSG